MNDSRIDIRVEVVAGEELTGYRRELSRIHASAFGTGQEGAARYEHKSLPEMTALPGFIAVVGYQHGEIAGFACGHDASPHQPWASRVFGALVKNGLREWTQNPFEFADIAVHPDAQNQGIGRLLLHTVVANVSHRNILLVTYHGQNPVKSFYHHSGWVDLIEDFEYQPGSPLTSILGLENHTSSVF